MGSLFHLIKQYQVFLLFIFLEIISFWLVVTNNYYQNATFFNSANVYVGNVLRISNGINSYFNLSTSNKELAEENRQLRKELTRFRQKNPLNGSVLINDEKIINQFDFTLAQVINNSTNKGNNYITIDKGKLDGISKDMAVISPLGIVGRIVKCNNRFSTAISLLHSKMSVSAQIKKNNELGIIKWDGKSPKFAKMFNVPDYVKVSVGDTIVASGYNSIFPAKTNIGIVRKIKVVSTFYELDVELTTNFNSLSYVYVVKNILKIEQESLEMETYKEIEE